MRGLRLLFLALVALVSACGPALPRPISAEAVGAYEVRRGDSVFSIAATFGLQPKTIVMSNYDLLRDDPHSLRPGMVLTILPIDGVYYEWQERDTIESVAARFGVEALAIVAWPGNRLDLEAYLEGETPAIAAGSRLVLPGGSRDLASAN